MNKTQKTLVELLIKSKEMTSQQMKEKTGISYETIMRNMKELEKYRIVDVRRAVESNPKSQSLSLDLERRKPWVNYYKLHEK